MRAIATSVLFLFATVLPAQEPVSNKNREIVFRNVSVVPMDSEKILDNQTVVVRDGRIVALGNSRGISFSRKALIIDGQGKFLIPGLAEMHAHVPPADDMAPMKEILMLFVTNGITTIRGMLGHPRHLELRSLIRNGEVLGPNFYTTGPSFNGMSVTSPKEGARMVRRQKEAGYDLLKLHPGLSRAKFDTIAQAAHEAKIPFAGHVSFGVGIWRAIEAGYASIDHLDGFVEALVPDLGGITEQQAGLFGMFVAHRADEGRIRALMEALKNGKIWVVPTQSLAERWFNPDYRVEDFRRDPRSAYISPRIVDQWIRSKNSLAENPSYNEENIRNFILLRRKLIKACQDHGVGLLLGCDAPQVFNVPGFSTHDELSYLVKAGLSPYEALLTGTRNVARYFGKADSGVIRQGSVADLVLLDGNPLVDITQTRNIAGVMIGTNWLSREYIRKELEKLEKLQ